MVATCAQSTQTLFRQRDRDRQSKRTAMQIERARARESVGETERERGGGKLRNETTPCIEIISTAISYAAPRHVVLPNSRGNSAVSAAGEIAMPTALMLQIKGSLVSADGGAKPERGVYAATERKAENRFLVATRGRAGGGTARSAWAEATAGTPARTTGMRLPCPRSRRRWADVDLGEVKFSNSTTRPLPDKGKSRLPKDA